MLRIRRVDFKGARTEGEKLLPFPKQESADLRPRRCHGYKEK